MKEIEDIDLAAAISARLQIDPRVPSEVIVGVSNLVVTLEGEAETQEQREAAEALVRQFRGVAGVVNGIILKAQWT
jgi:osmotically-inducible protein OsmY